MPVKRRVAKRRNATVAEYHLGQLEHGWQWFPDDGFGDWRHGTFDWEWAAETWEDVRDEILARWVRERPGTRPWFWWHADAPEKWRRCLYAPTFWLLSPEAEGLFDPGDLIPWFGKPSVYAGEDLRHCATGVAESQADYLRRHGLMTPEEEAALAARPAPPFSFTA